MWPQTQMPIHTIAVVVAGGKGLRMQSDIKKQYIQLGGLPILARTLSVFVRHPRVDRTILVVPESDLDYCRREIVPAVSDSQRIALVGGGNKRQDSVANGLATAKTMVAVDNSCPLVLVHDGVRPFVPRQLIDQCIKKARKTGACIPALNITDTIKKADSTGCIIDTLDRSRLYRAQTPQVFRLDLLISAYDKAAATGFIGTDEASMLEHAGLPVHIVAGDPFNIKLTTPEDIHLAEFILKKIEG